VVSIAIALVIVAGTWGLFRESLDLALDAVPRGVDVAAIEAALGRVAGVAAVNDLHVWGPSTSEVSLTAHLAAAPDADTDALLAEATRVVRETFHIAHSTIQIERPQ